MGSFLADVVAGVWRPSTHEAIDWTDLGRGPRTTGYDLLRPVLLRPGLSGQQVFQAFLGQSYLGQAYSGHSCLGQAYLSQNGLSERDIDCGWGCGHPWVPTPYLKRGVQYALPVSTSVLLQREGSPSPPLAWPSSAEVMLLDGSSLHEQFFVDSQTTCEASRFPHSDHETPLQRPKTSKSMIGMLMTSSSLKSPRGCFNLAGGADTPLGLEAAGVRRRN